MGFLHKKASFNGLYQLRKSYLRKWLSITHYKFIFQSTLKFSFIDIVLCFIIHEI